MSSPSRMKCAYCGRLKSWPNGFVSSTEATCWPCWWQHHLEAEHPVKRRWKLRWPVARDSDGAS